MEKQTDLRIRSYGRTELLLHYNPQLAPNSAYRKFSEWINHYSGLAALGDRERPVGIGNIYIKEM